MNKHLNKLCPIATTETRHLFVDPAIYQPFSIIECGYVGEQSSFLKPGKIPNLMELCVPKGIYFSVTEEPDFNNMFIEEILFGMHYKGSWEVFRVPVMIHLEQCDQSNWGLKRTIEIPVRSVININSGVTGIELKNGSVLNIDLDINYARATRSLEYSTSGSYDNGKPQILGLCFDLEHLDSRSPISLFKSKPEEVKSTYYREIVA